MHNLTAPLAAALAALIHRISETGAPSCATAVNRATDLLAEVTSAGEPTLGHAFELAGTLRNLNLISGLNDEAAGEALRDFDCSTLPVHAHYMTEIIRDGEPFDVTALTSNGAAAYAASGRPGDMLAFVPLETPGGEETARRLALACSQPLLGGYPGQVGNALRSAKALIEALLAGERRSEADMRDVLLNFDGLAGLGNHPAGGISG